MPRGSVRSCVSCSKAINAQSGAYVVFGCCKDHAQHVTCHYEGSNQPIGVLCPVCTEKDAHSADLTVAQFVSEFRDIELTNARKWLDMSTARQQPLSFPEIVDRSSLVQRCCAKGAPFALDEEGVLRAVVMPKIEGVALTEPFALDCDLPSTPGQVLSLQECFTGSKTPAETHHLHGHFADVDRCRHTASILSIFRVDRNVSAMKQLSIDYAHFRASMTHVMGEHVSIKKIHQTTGCTVGDLVSLGASWEDLVHDGLAEVIGECQAGQMAPVIEYVSVSKDSNRPLYRMILDDLFRGNLRTFFQIPFSAEDMVTMGFTPEEFCESHYAANTTHTAWSIIGKRMTASEFADVWGWKLTTINTMLLAAGVSKTSTPMVRVKSFLVHTMGWSPTDIASAFSRSRK